MGGTGPFLVNCSFPISKFFGRAKLSLAKLFAFGDGEGARKLFFSDLKISSQAQAVSQLPYRPADDRNRRAHTNEIDLRKKNLLSLCENFRFRRRC